MSKAQDKINALTDTKNKPLKRAPTENVPDLSGYTLKMPEDETLQGEKTTGSLNLVLVLIGIVVILIGVLIGLYLWGGALLNLQQQPEVIVPTATRPTAAENNEPESTNAEADVTTTQAVSTSDELDLIKADLEGTMIENLDSDLRAIESELAQ